MEAMTVDIRVGAALKEYIVATNGSDILTPEKDTVLWAMLKQHLVTCAGTYRPITDRSEYVSIALRPTKDAKAYNIPAGRVMSVNTLFRSFLTPKGENVIRRHFEKEFKKTFRDYMKGAKGNNTDMMIKDAIEKFCSDHNLSMTEITFEMLKKDWYRFSKKTSTKLVCTLLF